MIRTRKSSQTEEQEELASDERLEAILFQFLKLYERWSEDRQVFAKQGADLDKFIKEFAQQVSKFARLEEAVRKEIHVSLHTEANKIANHFGNTISGVAIKAIEPFVRQLNTASETATSNLEIYHSQSTFDKWKMVGATVFSSIILSLSIVWFLMPKPVIPLTDGQLRTYNAGVMFQSILPKLSQKQQQWLHDLSYKNI